jgi:hypothetical protein
VEHREFCDKLKMEIFDCKLNMKTFFTLILVFVIGATNAQEPAPIDKRATKETAALFHNLMKLSESTPSSVISTPQSMAAAGAARKTARM